LAAAAEVDELVDRRLTFRLSLDIIRHVATVSVAHRTWLQLHTTLEAAYRRNRLVQETLAYSFYRKDFSLAKVIFHPPILRSSTRRLKLTGMNDNK